MKRKVVSQGLPIIGIQGFHVQVIYLPDVFNFINIFPLRSSLHTWYREIQRIPNHCRELWGSLVATIQKLLWTAGSQNEFSVSKKALHLCCREKLFQNTELPQLMFSLRMFVISKGVLGLPQEDIPVNHFMQKIIMLLCFVLKLGLGPRCLQLWNALQI